MRRRAFLKLSAGAFALGPVARVSAQSKWPDRPVRIVVPYAAGGATDAVARPWAEVLGAAFGQQFVIENRGGASGLIGNETVAKAAPDGYTFLLTSQATLTVLPHLRTMPYDPFKSLEPVGNAGEVVCGFVINPALGLKTFQEMVDYAKKNPGKLSYGSSGAGTGTHLRLEMLKQKAGVDILHVPYRGGADTVIDVLSNTVNMMNEPVSLPHVKAGKLTLLNINHPTRSPDFPDVPTLTELGHSNADIPLAFALYAPAGTPKAIISTINAKMRELALTADLKEKLWRANATVIPRSPEQIVEATLADSRVNAELIKAAKIKLD